MHDILHAGLLDQPLDISDLGRDRRRRGPDLEKQSATGDEVINTLLGTNGDQAEICEAVSRGWEGFVVHSGVIIG